MKTGSALTPEQAYLANKRLLEKKRQEAETLKAEIAKLEAEQNLDRILPRWIGEKMIEGAKKLAATEDQPLTTLFALVKTAITTHGVDFDTSDIDLMIAEWEEKEKKANAEAARKKAQAEKKAEQRKAKAEAEAAKTQPQTAPNTNKTTITFGPGPVKERPIPNPQN